MPVNCLVFPAFGNILLYLICLDLRTVDDYSVYDTLTALLAKISISFQKRF